MSEDLLADDGLDEELLSINFMPATPGRDRTADEDVPMSDMSDVSPARPHMAFYPPRDPTKLICKPTHIPNLLAQAAMDTANLADGFNMAPLNRAIKKKGTLSRATHSSKQATNQTLQGMESKLPEINVDETANASR